ncbi:MAG: hypothetical protein ACI9G9_000132 [Psychromonas sp.]|jgi:hypothetical protein
MTNIEQIKGALHEFTNAIDFKSNTIEEVLKYPAILNDILGLSHLNTYVMNVPTEDLILTRARKNIKNGVQFSNISQLIYPKNELVTNHGRANTWRQSRYYCSDVPGTALLEVRPHNEWITSIDIRISKPELNLLAISMDSKYKISAQRILNDADIAFNEFMSEKFVEEVPKGKEYLYLPTAILTNLLITEVDGIVYPSFASNLKGENFVLKTEIIDNYAQATDFRVQESYNHKGKGKFDLKCLYRAKSISNNGEIDWKPIKCGGHFIDETIYHRKHT